MKMKITLHGVSYEVDVEILDEGEGFFGTGASVPKVVSSTPELPTYNTTVSEPHVNAKPLPSGSQQGKIAAPVGGTVVEIKLKAGDSVKLGEEILVLDAMKMNTSIQSPVDGKIKAILVAAGDTVREGEILVELA